MNKNTLVHLILGLSQALVLTATLLTASVNAQTSLPPEQFQQGKASATELFDEGMRLFDEAGVGRDKSEAIAYFKAAGEQNNLQAQLMLGDMYAFGAGVAPDYTLAAYWFIKAAALGSPKAQLYMGDLYANGLGVEKDLHKAIEYMAMAASNPNADKESAALAGKRLKALREAVQ